MFNFLNLFQMPVHLTYISIINKFSYDFYLMPAILTDGFLWFKDLSQPDPYFILPVVTGCV